MAKKKKSQVQATEPTSNGAAHGSDVSSYPLVKNHPSPGRILEPAQPQPPTLVICRNKYVAIDDTVQDQYTSSRPATVTNALADTGDIYPRTMAHG